MLQVFIVHEFNEITSDKLFLTEKIDKLKLHKVYICFCSFEGTVLGKNPIAVSISRIGGLATMNIRMCVTYFIFKKWGIYKSNLHE